MMRESVLSYLVLLEAPSKILCEPIDFGLST